jgi:hypothetical protein
MKGAIKPDHMATNKYELLVLGLPPLTPTEISGLEDELQTTELPDRTRASGGNRGPSEMEITLPMHHLVEQAAMELWYKESQDPVVPSYKKVATLLHKSISGAVLRTYSLIAVFPTKRVLPDLEMSNEGEMAVVKWTLSVDDILPV